MKMYSARMTGECNCVSNPYRIASGTFTLHATLEWLRRERSRRPTRWRVSVPTNISSNVVRETRLIALTAMIDVEFAWNERCSCRERALQISTERRAFLSLPRSLAPPRAFELSILESRGYCARYSRAFAAP